MLAGWGGGTMNELEQLKQRAAERREKVKTTHLFTQGQFLPDVEADLDRAIAIAERFPLIEDVMKHYPMLARMECKRDK